MNKKIEKFFIPSRLLLVEVFFMFCSFQEIEVAKTACRHWFLAKKVYLHPPKTFFLWWITNHFGIFPRSHKVINFEQECGEIENFSSGIGVFHIIMLKFELFAALLFERQRQTNVPKGQKKCRTLTFAP